MQYGASAAPQSRAPEHTLLPQGYQSASQAAPQLRQHGVHAGSSYVGFPFSQGAGDATRRGAADHALPMQGHPFIFQAAPESGFQHAGDFSSVRLHQCGSQHGHGDGIHSVDVNLTELLHQVRDGQVTVQEAVGQLNAPQPLEAPPPEAPNCLKAWQAQVPVGGAQRPNLGPGLPAIPHTASMDFAHTPSIACTDSCM